MTWDGGGGVACERRGTGGEGVACEEAERALGLLERVGPDDLSDELEDDQLQRVAVPSDLIEVV